ncbi:hypothetical protein E9529_00525 [Blastococcus sp. KM273128]|uniref:hypothetical protein n=1 Tax=Blastococcus sp. KM273128 TaxID=2570314 RepID=UPI001F41A92A|nr:hypothetical protein [Blastococcus sp. KM273128]MCF6742776.1 hypothetical protein [Blastococcus sp. KM273128]
MHIDEREYKDVCREEKLDARVEPFREVAYRVNLGLAQARALLQQLPESVVYVPSNGDDSNAIALVRDQALVLGLLGSWKSLRFLQAATSAWTSPAATGFDPFLAASTIRAALEETSRTELAIRVMKPLVEAIEQRKPSNTHQEDVGQLARFLDRVLKEDDGRGLTKSQDPGVKKSVGEAVAAVPMFKVSIDDGMGLYSYLSAVVHAEGPGRALFSSGDEYEGGVWLSRNPSKYRVRSVRVATLAGSALVGCLVSAHWKTFADLVDRLEAAAGLDIQYLSPRLTVPPDDWFLARTQVTAQWRDGLWTRWAVL